jgi:hypothetical protein
MKRAKGERSVRRTKPEFGMTLMVVGLGAGLSAGAVVEIMTGTGVLVMQGGGFAGILVGAAVEAASYWRRQRVYHSTKTHDARRAQRA